MTTPLPTYQERAKLISELLIGLEGILPKLTDPVQIKKIKYEIKYHKKMLKECNEVLC